MAGLQTAGTITKDSLPAHAHVVLPDSEDWDLARGGFNLAVDQRPAAVAFAHDEEDVSRIVRFAAERGLRVAPQRTGHNAGPLGALEDTVLLRTDLMRGVELDAGTRRARVRAGARWADVVPRASELGLAALHGSTPDVSVVGYSLGGGLGWYGRKHGLASNSVTAIELVTADGELHRVDRDHEADLFWALRGGGGSFGVVTAIEFDLLPIAEVYAGALFFPIERSAEVLHAWHAWLDGVPDEVTSVGRILQFPPLPDIPEPLRGNAFALVEAVYVGSEAGGAELLQPLRELGPAIDTFAMVPPAGISELHMDPRDPIPYAADHMLVGALPEQAIDDLVAVAGPGSGSPLLSFELRHIGGALARSEPGDGALSKLAGSFCMFGVGVTPDEDAAAALHAHFGLIRDTLVPYDAGSYLNFTEHKADTARFFPRDVENRLRMIKGAVDPTEVFHANHAITPAP
jgi:FAD/FMN-containing dehydrogenase